MVCGAAEDSVAKGAAGPAVLSASAELVKDAPSAELLVVKDVSTAALVVAARIEFACELSSPAAPSPGGAAAAVSKAELEAAGEGAALEPLEEILEVVDAAGELVFSLWGVAALSWA